MIESLLAGLESSSPAVMLRNSLWIYPVVNAGHILGIALLVGGVLPLDLRLLGLWPKVPLLPLYRVLGATVAVGVVLALVCGFLLFSTRATAYFGSAVFMSKMILVAAGLVNGLLMRLTVSPQYPPPWFAENRIPPRVRLSALVSLLIWPTALVLGRLIAYVH
jgi:hypothetical protein